MSNTRLGGVVWALLLVLGLAVASAQEGRSPVVPDLQEPLCASPLPAEVSPIAALAGVVRLFEPALPRLIVASGFALDAAHPDFADFRYLRERRILGPAAVVDPMSRETWQEAFDAIAQWYRIDPIRVGDPLDPAARARDIAGLVADVARAVRPLALVAWAEGVGEPELGFLGLVWNWSVYPRLIVWRPDAVGGALAASTSPLLAAQQLSSCAVEVRHYVAARASVARDLFLARNSARMWLVASEPARSDWPREVPLGEEVAIFDFSHDWVTDLDAFAAVFVGEQAPLLNFVSLLPQLRTNVSPLSVPRFLAIPD